MAREYKDSGIEWIGRIPKEWKISAIKHLMTLYAGATPKSDQDELWDGSIPWVTPADYKTEDVYVSKGRRNISVAGLSSCATTLLPIDSIIFSKRAPIGLVALNNVPLCTNQGCIGCVPYKQKANSKYYYYVLSVFTDQFELFGSGTTFKEISANNFANFIVSVPPLPEQQRIADYLDKKCEEIDELIALQEQMIAQLTDYKQSVITEAVTKGLNPNAELVPSGIDWIGEVPKGWKVCRFKSIAAVKANLVSPDLYLDYPQVAPDNIEKGSGKLLSWKKVKEAGIISDNHLFFKGQIVYSKIRPMLNKVIIAPFDGLCSADMYPIETKLVSKYLLYYMLSSLFTQQVQRYVNDRVKMPKINKEEIANILTIIPSESEQHTIATYLDTRCSEIDSLIAIKQQKIETLKDYKKSVIYEAVTGKIIV